MKKKIVLIVSSLLAFFFICEYFETSVRDVIGMCRAINEKWKIIFESTRKNVEKVKNEKEKIRKFTNRI